MHPKQLFFRPKRPRYPLKRTQRREMVATLNICHGGPGTKTLLLPSYSAMCPRNGQKMAQIAHNLCRQAPKQTADRVLGYLAPKPSSEGTWSTCNPPLFVVSKHQNCPTRRLDARPSGHLVELEGSPGRAPWGPTVGPPGSPGGKTIFPKVFPTPLVFLAHFEPVVTW